MLRTVGSLLFFFFIVYGLHAQISQGFDQIPILNYTRNDYKAGNQNWSIAQDKHGIMYFGNNNGLLSFDGQTWKQHILPNHTTVRSVACSENGKIFVGSFEEFGYFEADKYGDLHYTSLAKQLKSYDFHNEEIWNIVIHEEAVYFQSFMVIFKYSNNRIEKIIPDGFVPLFVKVNNQLLAIVYGKGLFEIIGNQFSLLSDDQFFMQKEISSILYLDQNNLLISTLRDGIFIYNKQRGFESWKTEAQVAFKHDQVNKGLITKDGRIIFGTILNGVYILNRKGIVMQHISKKNGLQNNTVLNLFCDENGDAWLGLDRGIDLLILNSDISFFYDYSGKIGSVYAISLNENQLFIGTNQGLYHTIIQTKSTIPLFPDFELINNSQGQVWSIYDQNKQMLCGHNRGTFELDKNKLFSVSDISGGMSYTPFRYNGVEYLLGSTYTFLVLYEKKEGKWRFRNTIEGFMHPVKQVKVDYMGNIWASHFVKGLYRISLNDSLNRVKSIIFYGKEKGFNSDYQINVTRLQNRIVFINQGKLFIYNDLLDSIVSYKALEEQLKVKIKVKFIAQHESSSAWIIAEQGILNINYKNERWELIKTYPADLFYDKVISGQEFILPLANGDALLALDNGLAYIRSENTSISSNDLKKPLLTKIISSGKEESALSLVQDKNNLPVLKASGNNLIFQFAYPIYRNSSYFLVQLKGLDNRWIKTSFPEMRFDRIPPGNYTFLLKAVDSRGQISDTTEWRFSVNSPWYASRLAQIFYAAVIISLIFYIRFYYKKRLKNQARRLKVEKERELIKLRNEKLEAEITHKSKELANTTLAIIKKNELLLELRRLLLMQKRQSQTGGSPKLNGIVNLLDRNISNEADWQVFENNFEQAHEEFLKRLREKIPDLTPSDLKLSAFLRMNLSSKKIALLLGITIRGVENHRYRLRKKLGLEHDSNLIDYLMNF